MAANPYQYERSNPAPNSAIAIYSDAESASKLLKASPLRFTLEKVSTVEAPSDQSGTAPGDEAEDAEFTIGRGSGRTDAEELVRPSTLIHGAARDGRWGSFGQKQSQSAVDQAPAKPSSEPPHTSADTSSSSTTSANSAEEHVASTKEFKLIADVSKMDHRKYLEVSPYYHGYNPSKSIMADDLVKSVPLRGLSEIDMKLPEIPLRKAQRRAQEIAERATLRQLWELGMGKSTALHTT